MCLIWSFTVQVMNNFFLLLGDGFGGEAFHDLHLIQHLQNSCSFASVCMSEAARKKKELEDSASWEPQCEAAILMQMLFNQKQFCSSLYLITMAIKITF